MNILVYKGFSGTIDYCGNVLWGKLLNTDTLITYESVDGTEESLEQEFRIAVDEFISVTIDEE